VLIVDALSVIHVDVQQRLSMLLQVPPTAPAGRTVLWIPPYSHSFQGFESCMSAVFGDTNLVWFDELFNAWGTPKGADAFDVSTQRAFLAWLQQVVFPELPRSKGPNPQALQAMKGLSGVPGGQGPSLRDLLRS
jgi:hypothetical protein